MLTRHSVTSLLAPALLTALAVLAIPALSACEGSTLASPPSATLPASSSGGDEDATPAVSDDAGIPTYDDGTPTRVACTSALGTKLTSEHGRLDGELVAIVAQKERGCPADATHLHLQVKMGGAAYDIAVNLDGFEGEIDAPLAGIPFAEGWHPMDLDYVTAFGLHSTAFTLTGAAAIRARVVTALTNANHISVYGYGYDGFDGAHLIHRVAGGHDGALVVAPLAAKAHVIAFRFAADAF